MIQQLALHSISGTCKGIAILSILLLIDAGGLKTLILHSGNPYFLHAVLVLLLTPFTATFDVIIAIYSSIDEG